MTAHPAPRSATWTREKSLQALTNSSGFDLLVVGGGIIGSALALDAAGRGLSVALVERQDFSSGTSSKSTKLLHGGIRYLPHMRFGLIREGLSEQAILRTTADYLFTDLAFAIPLYRGRGLADLPGWMSGRYLLPPLLRAGLTLYDLLGRRRGSARHCRLNAAAIADRFPALRTEGLRGGYLYQDAQTDDARLTICVLKTAVHRYGATAVSRVTAQTVTPGNGGFRVTLRDGDTTFAVKTRSVVAATWAFTPPQLDGQPAQVPIQLSKGVHLLYRCQDLALGQEALVLPETNDGRILFVVPWRGMALVGTTDTPYTGDPAAARPEPADIDYLQSHLQSYLQVGEASPLTAFAGLRVLAGASDSTAAASREHEIVEHTPGYLQVVGGKLTAFRAIAVEVVDRVCARLGITAKSRTAVERLIGAGITETFQAQLEAQVQKLGLPGEYGQTLIDRYGRESVQIVGLLKEQAKPAQVTNGITWAEAVYAARHESADTIADFALRRTHLAWRDPDRGRQIVGEIAQVMAGELGWSDQRKTQALAEYEQALAAEKLFPGV